MTIQLIANMKTKFGDQILYTIPQASQIYIFYRTLQLAVIMGVLAKSSQTSRGYYIEMCPTFGCKAYMLTWSYRVAIYVQTDNL
jgi:hypothetical protein